MLSDLEIERAIESLEASTAAIETQCRALESQKTYLEQLASRNKASSPRQHLENREQQDKKFARDRAQSALEADEMAQTLTARLQLATKQVESSKKKAPTNVERLLEKDDRLLGGLQKVVPRLSDVADQSDSSEEIEELCSMLTSLATKEIHAQLDATYASTILKNSASVDEFRGGPLSEQQVKQRETLRAELEELGGEIESLVAIAIDNHYRKPLKRSMQTARTDSLNQKQQWWEYTVDTLQYMAARMDILNEHVQHIHGHNAALRTISGALQEMTKTPLRTAEQGGAPAISRQSSAKGLKPLRLVQANISDQDPTLLLLRQLEVRVADGSGPSGLAEVLSRTLKERRDKLQNLNDTTGNLITEAVSNSLAKTDNDVQEVLSAAYAHSSFNSIKLVDPDVQKALDRLEVATQSTGDEMRELDIDALTRKLKEKQAEAVARMA